MLISYDFGLLCSDYFIYGLSNIAVSSSDYEEWNDWVTANNELQRMCSIPNLRHYPSICLEGLGQSQRTSVRIVIAPPQIQTRHFSNSSQKCYCLRQLA
jgi:hypothetical protein